MPPAEAIQRIEPIQRSQGFTRSAGERVAGVLAWLLPDDIVRLKAAVSLVLSGDDATVGGERDNGRVAAWAIPGHHAGAVSETVYLRSDHPLNDFERLSLENHLARFKSHTSSGSKEMCQSCILSEQPRNFAFISRSSSSWRPSVTVKARRARTSDL